MNKETLPPIGEELAAHFEAFHRKGGMRASDAQETGYALAELILSVYAGQQVTFPVDPMRARYLEERNAQIRSEFTGKNAPVLAHKFGLTRRQIWNIVKDSVKSDH